MATNDIAAAARAICEEKGISLEAVIETIESALAAAYRKDFGEKNQNIKVDFDLDAGSSRVFDEKIVVEDMPAEVEESEIETELEVVTELKKAETAAEVDKAEEEVRRFNPRTEIQISDAKILNKKYTVGDVIRTGLSAPAEYGRMAAQTAKQVIIQRLREIERANVYEEYKGKEHEVVVGVVQRREGKIVIVDLGKTTGVIPPDGQIAGERYESGQRVKVYVETVNTTARGPEILLSRTSPEIVRKVFYTEIPEITNGLIEIKSVAREAGLRSKIAVAALEENVDPIGSCVGQRGARIQTIISELGGEKVDIIEYSEEPNVYITHALAPAKVAQVSVDEASRQAVAKVSEDQLSLAIGRGGQNVRLAARLTGWKIDIQQAEGSKKEEVENENEEVEKESTEDVKEEKIAKKSKSKKAEKKDVKAKENVEETEEKVEN
ncbi:transcription termination factor NusA [Candidatus Falkowbacteria bacterium RIFOXYC2_FULL_47_12]|uniref:Transcription termination/antitermination protein NusA n=2 Tax=Candidatus Falkowiibacteriota TaxID=1752728 RepID=A0A1F5TMQ8_9BACT|nr:MAG: transcription termination factor NusA [Candidatus Falkowbacteria bacterium RIFOXYA2_FULL_47_9]OGF40262.1 MAG: transcription termination factor NusA [Candidatus Falkowbacteria bacterium RIFOXYC2_FULL_47_12]